MRYSRCLTSLGLPRIRQYLSSKPPALVAAEATSLAVIIVPVWANTEPARGCPSDSLDDKVSLIVNTVLFASLAQTIAFFHRAFPHCIAALLCSLSIVLTHYRTN